MDGPVHDPTPQEIRRKSWEIQREWSAEARLKRIADDLGRALATPWGPSTVRVNWRIGTSRMSSRTDEDTL